LNRIVVIRRWRSCTRARSKILYLSIGQLSLANAAWFTSAATSKLWLDADALGFEALVPFGDILIIVFCPLIHVCGDQRRRCLSIERWAGRWLCRRLGTSSALRFSARVLDAKRRTWRRRIDGAEGACLQEFDGEESANRSVSIWRINWQGIMNAVAYLCSLSKVSPLPSGKRRTRCSRIPFASSPKASGPSPG
jgi:hypothetical protein